MPDRSVFLSLVYVWCIFTTAVNCTDGTEAENDSITITPNDDYDVDTTLVDSSDHCYVRANLKEFPFMALIGYGSRENVTWDCAGTLISSRYVLSAAYCTDTYFEIRPSTWVRLGDLDISADTDDASPNDYSITEIIKHPDYNAPQAYNDIVLYKLDREVLFSDYIKPVCLRRNELSNETAGKVTGWGIVETGPVTSSHLLTADTGLLSNEDCSSTLTYKAHQLKQGIDWRSQICTTTKTKNGKSCLGDMGGPLLAAAGDESCPATQLGVTSRTIYCANVSRYCGIYTKVSYFLPWIESIVKPA